ncbi:hypothetical protein PO878_01485 [Iamia majanohamensis]|uniref:Uncharacterized protein n=1 Tax=Iamia majanohamensis TaxID=467976 RepID=A0AAF0BWF6_9ACTN|nr:hypothetical protein [Iamia majanohamensis]WCO67389.1 hypothetical protein PO878_01485 [Iamia majanohamensis]
MREYWIRQWLDALDLSDVTSVGEAIKNAANLDLAETLAAAAAAAEFSDSSESAGPKTAIASRVNDLSGITTCKGSPCLQRDLEHGLSHAFQYFDTIVVEGYAPFNFCSDIETDRDEASWDLKNHASVLLRAAQIGVEPHLDFRTKPNRFCSDHFETHAAEIGLTTALDPDLSTAAIELIATGAKMETENMGEDTWYYFTSPVLETGSQYIQHPGEEPPSIEGYADSEFRKICTSLVGDAAMSQHLGAPLTADARRLVDLAPTNSRDPSLADVALSLQLPVLAGLSTRELLKVRGDHEDEFEIFRAAITAAIDAKLRADPGKDPAQVAREVESDIVAPELAKLRLSLSKARSVLDKKMLGGVAVGALTTVVGLVTAMPLIIAPGLATLLGAPVVGHSKFLEDKSAIELKDLYFLHLADRQFSHK